MGKGGRQNLGAELKNHQIITLQFETRRRQREIRLMATTYINTNQCSRVKMAEPHGTMAQIVNEDLCGAKNVVGILRGLNEGECFQAELLKDKHQLIYVMEGQGTIALDDKEYQVTKGAGIYLGPCETSGIRQTGTGPLKLFHLLVKKGDEGAV